MFPVTLVLHLLRALELYLLTGLKSCLLLAAMQDMSMKNTPYP